MTALSPLEVDKLAVVVSDLDDGDGVVLRSAQVVDLCQNWHEAKGAASAVDISGLPLRTINHSHRRL